MVIRELKDGRCYVALQEDHAVFQQQITQGHLALPLVIAHGLTR